MDAGFHGQAIRGGVPAEMGIAKPSPATVQSKTTDFVQPFSGQQVHTHAPLNFASRETLVGRMSSQPKPPMVNANSREGLSAAAGGKLSFSSLLPDAPVTGTAGSSSPVGVTKEHVEFACYAEFSPFYPDGVGSAGLFKPARDSLSLEMGVVGHTKTELKEELAKLGFKHSLNGMFYNEKTGTSFFIVIQDKQITACFGGLGSEQGIQLDQPKEEKRLHAKMGKANTKAAIKDFLGFTPSAVKEAINIGTTLRGIAENSGFTPVVVGHSHGGGLAQCAASAAGIKGVVFNARPVGLGARKAIEEHRKGALVSNAITSFTTKGDWVASKNGALARLARAISPFTKEKRPVSIATTAFEIERPNFKGLGMGYFEKFVGKHNSFSEGVYELSQKSGEFKNELEMKNFSHQFSELGF